MIKSKRQQVFSFAYLFSYVVRDRDLGIQNLWKLVDRVRKIHCHSGISKHWP